MTTLEIIELVILAVLAIGLAVYYGIKIVKNKWLSQLKDTIEKAMKEAEEKWPQGHGEEKKQYVLDALKAKCEELSIPYTLLVTVFGKLIATIVEHWNILK